MFKVIKKLNKQTVNMTATATDICTVNVLIM